MRIGVDIASGEKDSHLLVKGSIDGALLHPQAEVVMIGNKTKLQKILDDVCEKSKIIMPDNISIMHAGSIITMFDEPLSAIKMKPDSSIVVGLEAHKRGELDAFFSPGNTGAIVVGASLILRRLRGIKKPALATFISKGIHSAPPMILDIGASSETTVEDLLKFGLMGQIYYERMVNVSTPKVALLNIGAEEYKGSKLARATYQAMKHCNFLNFIGNIEGKEFFKGKANVIVCDGFLGNIVLKTIEGTASGFSQMLKYAFKSSLFSLFGALLAKPAFQKVKDALDPEYFGGAPLLGVQGVVMIGHGSSGSLAFKNAIDACVRTIENNVIEELNNKIEENLIHIE
ncbi:MAG: phosphate acyltransferase PlsX [Spirochaetota bacterium]|nr:phosphate acyltransferase PlsX [Spirochaetota bacterium]